MTGPLERSGQCNLFSFMVVVPILLVQINTEHYSIPDFTYWLVSLGIIRLFILNFSDEASILEQSFQQLVEETARFPPRQHQLQQHTLLCSEVSQLSSQLWF